MLGVAGFNGARTDLAILDIYELVNNFITLCGIVWLDIKLKLRHHRE
jgi:hypothetical protein